MKWISYVLRYSNRNKGERKKWCMKKWAGRRTQERWGSKDQDIALKLRELSVDTAGGWWGENHVREYHAVTNHPAISQLRLICQPSVTQPLLTLSFFTFSQRNWNISLCGFVLSSQASHYGTSVGSWGQRCYWTWQKRISGPVGGENSRPAVENQLVSRPASPAPSVSHLLDLLGGLLNLCASRSSQRLCHRIWPYRGSSTMTVKWMCN